MRTNCTSLSKEESRAIDKFLERLAKRRKVIGACLYGSKVAGYESPDSDIDIIVVVKGYPYTVRYSYFRSEGLRISALIVDHIALQKDAQTGFLGEFVAGRLLHTYEAIINQELFKSIEILYKKRVILEELLGIIRTTSILCTEISFPLEFIVFSKIKQRSLVYPSALYSYYKIYTGRRAATNLAFALEGYRKALEEIMTNDKELLILKTSSTTTDVNLLQISKKRLALNKQAERNNLRLMLARKLQVLNSYFVHAYAGRRVLHYTMQEAESKIRRHRTQPISLPEYMAYPREHYWKLEEGLVITRSNKKWLDLVAKSFGLLSYTILKRIHLGSVNSRTTCYTLQGTYNPDRILSVVAKNFSKLKGLKWATLNFWALSNYTLSKYPLKIDPLFRLGTEYKALRYLRNEVGLNTPAILAIDLERLILVTNFVEGQSMHRIIQDSLKKKSAAGAKNIFWIKAIGKNFAMVHATHFTLGNIKPNNIIVNNADNSNGSVFFTSLDQFDFSENGADSDPVWDIIQFLCRSLKRTTNTSVAKEIVREFLSGYFSFDQASTTNDKASKIKDLRQELFQKSMDYLGQFYPLISSSIARSIHEEISRFAD
jgi:tRNA A-37 threonylcarbamoyl transferase component Bud32/predicted nucleotidyltransferase